MRVRSILAQTLVIMNRCTYALVWCAVEVVYHLEVFLYYCIVAWNAMVPFLNFLLMARFLVAPLRRRLLL